MSAGYVPGVSEPKGMSDSIGWLFDWSVKQMATHSGGLSPPSWFLDRLRRLSQPGHIRLTAAQIRDRLFDVISNQWHMTHWDGGGRPPPLSGSIENLEGGSR